MKKEQIIKFLTEKLDNDREYEFWFNDDLHEFGGAYFFRDMKKQKDFERQCKEFGIE